MTTLLDLFKTDPRNATTGVLSVAALLHREAACRVHDDYRVEAANAHPQRAAAAISVCMAAYRVMPLFSWQGGPFYGATPSEEDRRYALFNLAGALQLTLRVCVDALTVTGERQGYTAKSYPDYTALYFADLDAVPEQTGFYVGGERMEYFTEPAPAHEVLTLMLDQVKEVGPLALPCYFLGAVSHFLPLIGCTMHDLAGAYLEATNELVPPNPADMPEGAEVGVYYPGAKSADDNAEPTLGRAHTEQEAADYYARMREAGFSPSPAAAQEEARKEKAAHHADTAKERSIDAQ